MFRSRGQILYRKGEITWWNPKGCKGRERTHTPVHVCLRTCLSVRVGRSRTRLVLHWAMLDHNGTVPADTAGSAVPTAPPGRSPAPLSGDVCQAVQIFELGKPCRCCCALIFLAASTCHPVLLLLIIHVRECPSQTGRFTNAWLRAQCSLSLSWFTDPEALQCPKWWLIKVISIRKLSTLSTNGWCVCITYTFSPVTVKLYISTSILLEKTGVQAYIRSRTW